MKKNLFVFSILALILLQALILSLFAYVRDIDQDEGVYVTAARMVSKNFKPYIDFSTNQAPLFSLAYGYWMGLFGNTLFMARLLSVASAVILSLLLAYIIYKITRDGALTLIILFLYIFNSMMSLWQTPVKTYALSNLLLFCSFAMLATISYTKTDYLKALFAGIFLGLAFNTRFIFISLILPSVIFLALYAKSTGIRLSRFVLFAIGVLLSSLYSIALFLQGPDAFYFNVFKRHRLEVYSGVADIGGNALDSSGLLGGLIQKYKALYTLLTDPQYMILIIIGFIAAAILAKRIFHDKMEIAGYKDYLLALGFIVTISLAYLFTGFLHSQYFNQIIPYLLVISAIPIGLFLKSADRAYALRIAAIAFLLFYLLIGIPAISFTHISGISGKDGIWSISQTEEVAEIIREVTGKDDEILTWWPMYAFTADRKVIRGMEYGRFAYNDLEMKKITAEEAKRYKILTNEEIREIIGNHKAKAIVWNEKSPKEFKPLIDENYRVYKSVDGVSVYV